jgi:hypothetical protein
LELMEEEEEVVAVRTMKRMNISRSEYCSWEYIPENLHCHSKAM